MKNRRSILTALPLTLAAMLVANGCNGHGNNGIFRAGSCEFSADDFCMEYFIKVPDLGDEIFLKNEIVATQVICMDADGEFTKTQPCANRNDAPHICRTQLNSADTSSVDYNYFEELVYHEDYESPDNFGTEEELCRLYGGIWDPTEDLKLGNDDFDIPIFSE